jgi:uncharacterized membrane protein
MTEAETEAETEAGAGAGEGLLSSPHRLFALVDGVFAIAMTLLALDVKVPDDVLDTSAGFNAAAGDFYGHFGVFIAAFVITSRFWLSNHKIMSRLKSVDGGVLLRTMSFLAGISSVPVATAVLFRFGSAPQAVAFVSLLLSATSLLAARLWWYMSDPNRQLSEVDPSTRLPVLLPSLWNSGVFLLAIPVAYLLQQIQSSPDDDLVAYSLLTWLLLAFDGVFVGLVLRLRGQAQGSAG